MEPKLLAYATPPANDNVALTPTEVPIKLPFVRYSTRNTARQFQPRTATVIDKYRLCWKVANTQANATDAQGVIFAQIALNKVEGVDCETGTVDRSWVIAFIVLLFLWGLMFGLIWLVTCKIESCHEKVRLNFSPSSPRFPSRPSSGRNRLAVCSTGH